MEIKEQLLKLGENAPPFSWKNANGITRSTSDLQGNPWVLYFYPKDDTPGCTKEACGFRDFWSDFKAQEISVLGCSPDSEESHQKFRNKYDLPFELVSDSNKEIAKAYGVWGSKQFMGKKYEGVHRVTYIIDPQNKIAEVFPKVKPAEHARELINLINNLNWN